MPVILKCQQCGSLFDRDVYSSCPQCGGAKALPAFKVDYSGTGYGSVSNSFTPPPPNPSPFQLLPSPPELPPPTSSPFSFGSAPSFSFGSFQSPQPVVQRQSKRFTHQLIVAVLTGTGDAAIETIAKNLQDKHPGMSSLIHVHLKQGNPFEPTSHQLISISPSDKLAIQKATKPENQNENAATVEKVFALNTKKARCRLYLVAHGDDGIHFAGISGDNMALFVKKTLRLTSALTTISVVSCYGAGYIPYLYKPNGSEEENLAAIDEARRAPMDRNSFAAVFHRELKTTKHNTKELVTEVLARRANVNTDAKTQSKGTRFDPGYNKYDTTSHKAAWSKFRFYWEGETQKVAPVYSEGDTSAWPQDLGS